jgi:hypothetical protein
MRSTLFKKSKRLREDAGIALITTLLLMFLMSSMLVGFTILLISNQQLAGSNNDDVNAFYGAEAGMETLTASLGNLFSQTYSPSIAQIDALESSPPAIPGISYVTGSGASGYQIVPVTTNPLTGNPAPQISTIMAGPYQGMTAMLTDYTLTVNARTNAGREVKLQRVTETVGIPMFQFAIFCDVDCSFHAGSNMTVQGRVHGNGNLFLASGATLTMQGKVDAYKDIIREYMDNGASVSANWGGTVSITTNSGGTNFRSLGLTEGSIEGAAGCSSCANTNWPTISRGSSPTDYASNLINGAGSLYPQYSTGADLLNLGIVTMGAGATQPIDLIRRPVGLSENTNITGERYMAQSSLVILLSDNPNDIMQLPCVEPSTQPLDLSILAQPVANWPAVAPYSTLKTNMSTYGTIPLPLAASGSVTSYSSIDGYWLPGQNGTIPAYPIIKGFIKIQAQLAPYGSPCGSWKDVTAEILALGYAGRNINPVPQSLNGTSLNSAWYYSTGLSMGQGAAPGIPVSLPGAQLGSEYGNGSTTYQLSSSSVSPTTPYTSSYVSTTTKPYTCPDPHPNAILRLERIRDNPSSVYVNTATLGTTSPNLPYESNMEEVCGINGTTAPVSLAVTRNTGTTWVPQPYDFWENTLFDPREGGLRDTSTPSYPNTPTINGTMHYIELDVTNLTKWFAGTIGTSGQLTYDSSVAPNDFSVYISDRRGNYVASQTWTGTWPPTSPSTHETGEYGWNDIVNSVSNPTYGCPNGSLDTGEDLDSTGQLFTYGAASANINYVMDPSAGFSTIYNLVSGANQGNLAAAYGEYGTYPVATLTTYALKANPNCSAPSYTNGIWPMMYYALPNAPRENPALFFRRAVKIMDAKNLTGLGTCPGGEPCGLAIATENPAYVQGDYNANSAGNGFSDPNVGSSIAADAVTILSNNWHDVNSFSYAIYSNGSSPANPRLPSNTYWRAAVIGGKGVSFPEFGGDADNGTDGGMHNFLRYVENWGGGSFTVNYEGALVNLFTNRQATGIFKYGNTVYTVPTRNAYFDTNFLNPATLPPRTPLFRDVDTTGWTRLQLANQ